MKQIPSLPKPIPTPYDPWQKLDPTLAELEAAHRIEHRCSYCGKPGGH